MTHNSAASWQVILADLALILFMTTLAGLVSTRDRGTQHQRNPAISQPIAVYRETDGGEGLSEWLAHELPDSRTQLTVFARYRAADRSKIWNEAQQLAQQAALAGYQPRLIAEAGASNDVYVSIAYDAGIEDQAATIRLRPSFFAR